MKRWIFLAIAVTGLFAILSHSTRVESWLLHMKHRHAEKERECLVENWEVHFDEELGRMKDEARAMRGRLAGQRVKAEKTRIEIDTLRAREEEYDRLIRSFVERLEATEQVSAANATFTFAGRTFDAASGRAQLERYLVEMRALGAKLEHKAALHQAQLEVESGMGQALEAEEKRIGELTIEREKYVLQRELLAVRNEIAQTRALAENLSGDGSAPADGRMGVLLDALREASIEKQAELAALGDDPTGAAPLSLEDSAAQVSRGDELQAIEALEQRYRKEVGK